jgi:hypothetical protein
MNADLLFELLLNPCGMIAAGLVMYVAGDWASNGKDGLRRFGAALAGAVLIAVMTFGILRRADLLTLAFGAAGFGLFVLGTFWIVLSILSFILSALAAAMAPLVPDSQPKTIVQPQLPELQPEPAPPAPAPAPTREEVVQAAKQRYEDTLRLLENANLDSTEQRAAQEKAKQQYLRDLDEAMK